jgi:hypothetical protein
MARSADDLLGLFGARLIVGSPSISGSRIFETPLEAAEFVSLFVSLHAHAVQRCRS